MGGSGGKDGNRERARIRTLLRERGIEERRIAGWLIDFWIGQHARDEEEGRRIGLKRPSGMLFGSGG